MIPGTFQEWRNCIEKGCGIELTTTFVTERLRILQDKKHTETKNFLRLYGEDHLKQVIDWYKRTL